MLSESDSHNFNRLQAQRMVGSGHFEILRGNILLGVNPLNHRFLIPGKVRYIIDSVVILGNLSTVN